MERLANTSFLKELLAGFIPGSKGKSRYYRDPDFFLLPGLISASMGISDRGVKRKGSISLLPLILLRACWPKILNQAGLRGPNSLYAI
jgi:hypothetical protein